jgi:glycosyltransferase involved in cell wall biosynthesis
LSGRQGIAEVHNPPIDLVAFSLGNRLEGRRILGIASEEKVILYMGSFFYFSGLPEVLRAMQERGFSEKLVLVGGGEQEKELRSLAMKLGIADKVMFTGVVPFSDLPDLLAVADVAINPMEKTLVSNCALPNKVLQYMACGVPVVSTSLEGLVSTFGYQSGITWGSSPREVMSLAINLTMEHDLSSLSKLGSKSIQMFKANSDPAAFANFLNRVVTAK